VKVRWPDPDFVRRPPSASSLGWAVLAVGAGVAALAGWELQQARAATAEAAARVERLEQRQRATLSARSASVPAAPGGLPAPDTVRALRRVAQQLQRPWQPTFAAVEQASVEGVRWLSLDIEGETSTLRIEGSAPSAAEGLAVVDALAVGAGWSDVVLTRLQTAPARNDAGSTQQRFEIAARWGAAPGRALPDAGARR
jgi:Tfp pilus assembly protein PilN